MITRASIFVLLFSVVQVGRIHGQGAPGCSQTKAEFEVRTDKDSHPAKPEPDKALVYFLQDDLRFEAETDDTFRHRRELGRRDSRKLVFLCVC